MHEEAPTLAACMTPCMHDEAPTLAACVTPCMHDEAPTLTCSCPASPLASAASFSTAVTRILASSRAACEHHTVGGVASSCLPDFRCCQALPTHAHSPGYGAPLATSPGWPDWIEAVWCQVAGPQAGAHLDTDQLVFCCDGQPKCAVLLRLRQRQQQNGVGVQHAGQRPWAEHVLRMSPCLRTMLLDLLACITAKDYC
jgi:hypothetical protein